MTTPTTSGGSGGQVPRKPSRWEDLREVTRSVQPDNSVAETVGALTYGADGTAVNVNADGGLNVHVTGGGSGGGAVTIADGANVAQGTTTDAAVVTDTSGTVIGFLRGLVKLFAARIPVLGQTTMAGSTPVTLASNQTAVSVTATNSFALDATLTGGTQKSKLVDTGGTNVAVVDSSGALSGNMTKVGSTAVDTNSGTKSAGTQRVVIATDQPAFTTRMPVDPSGVTSPVSIAAAVAVTESGTWNVGLSKTGTGYTPYFMDAVTTTVLTVSTAAGKFGGLAGVINVNSGPAYLQCFDTTGAVTLGTTAPTFVIAIPANSTAANGVAIVADLGGVGLNLANGLKIAATTTAKGSSALGTGLSGTLYYA